MMRSVCSRCASEGTHVIFTCLPVWGVAISWFSICMSLPESSTNTAFPLFAVHSGSQVLRPFTFVTHCASQMAPVFFIVLFESAANSNVAAHRIPRNSQALRFIHASYRRVLFVHIHTLAPRKFGLETAFTGGVRSLLGRVCFHRAALLVKGRGKPNFGYNARRCSYSRSWYSSYQAIWMASSLPSLDILGSSTKVGNSVT